ncbi:MAG: propanediol utilization protein, partial [Clostridiales bacterium]|nr:propanediol utilization protein [Clostridiales bacterium]
GARSEFPGISILGPIRSATQVEITLTDARQIGVTAPVRESGDIAGSGGCELIGPNGSVTIEEGVICAKRHIHFNEEQAAEFGVNDKDIVSVKIDGSRPLVFGDVVCRVSKNYDLAMHIDVDETNAGGISPDDGGIIIK